MADEFTNKASINKPKRRRFESETINTNLFKPVKTEVWFESWKKLNHSSSWWDDWRARDYRWEVVKNRQILGWWRLGRIYNIDGQISFEGSYFYLDCPYPTAEIISHHFPWFDNEGYWLFDDPEGRATATPATEGDVWRGLGFSDKDVIKIGKDEFLPVHVPVFDDKGCATRLEEEKVASIAKAIKKFQLALEDNVAVAEDFSDHPPPLFDYPPVFAGVIDSDTHETAESRKLRLSGAPQSPLVLRDCAFRNRDLEMDGWSGAVMFDRVLFDSVDLHFRSDPPPDPLNHSPHQSHIEIAKSNFLEKLTVKVDGQDAPANLSEPLQLRINDCIFSNDIYIATSIASEDRDSKDTPKPVDLELRIARPRFTGTDSEIDVNGAAMGALEIIDLPPHAKVYIAHTYLTKSFTIHCKALNSQSDVGIGQPNPSKELDFRICRLAAPEVIIDGVAAAIVSLDEIIAEKQLIVRNIVADRVMMTQLQVKYFNVKNVIAAQSFCLLDSEFKDLTISNLRFKSLDDVGSQYAEDYMIELKGNKGRLIAINESSLHGLGWIANGNSVAEILFDGCDIGSLNWEKTSQMVPHFSKETGTAIEFRNSTIADINAKDVTFKKSFTMTAVTVKKRIRLDDAKFEAPLSIVGCTFFDFSTDGVDFDSRFELRNTVIENSFSLGGARVNDVLDISGLCCGQVIPDTSLRIFSKSIGVL